MIGGMIGLKRRATILKYNGDGTVVVRLDDGTSLKDDQNTHTVDFPTPYCDGLGAFIGGYPETGTPVYIEQGQGEWSISNYGKPDNIFIQNESIQGTLFDEPIGNIMADLQPGRLLLQSSGKANRIYLDKKEGISIGTGKSSMELDPRRDIISHNYGSEYIFTDAHREITSTIKRDLNSNSLRNIENSILEDHSYDDSLIEIGMDPEQITSTNTSNGTIRNLPLVEKHEIIYELKNLQPSLSFLNDNNESEKYDTNYIPKSNNNILRIDSRTNSFNMNLYNSNYLIEEIKGTGVDIFGNILDINRAILSIGTDKASFIDNEDIKDAFRNIRAEHRKSLAYHFEINARKQQNNNEIYEVPESKRIENNMGRFLSTFFMDIDKEGQFKVNIPASSETGNIPLPVRYINSSVIAYEDKQISDPNIFAQEEDFVDIFLEDFSISGRFDPKTIYQSKKGISLIGDEGEIGPIDTIKQNPIKLNTPYHNILDAGFLFTEEWLNRNKQTDSRAGIVRRPILSRLNDSSQGYAEKICLDKIVSDEIKVSGDNANAGGRSGSINTDGFIQIGLGANTVDRQSLWLDTAGGIISTIGRDKNGISHCASLDGDLLIQIGGVGVGNTTDNRFSNENDGIRAGALDVRVMDGYGQLTVVRIDKQGVIITTFGRLTIESQQDMTLRSNAQLNLDAELINFFEGTARRSLKRNGNIEI